MSKGSLCRGDSNTILGRLSQPAPTLVATSPPPLSYLFDHDSLLVLLSPLVCWMSYTR